MAENCTNGRTQIGLSTYFVKIAICDKHLDLNELYTNAKVLVIETPV